MEMTGLAQLLGFELVGCEPEDWLVSGTEFDYACRECLKDILDAIRAKKKEADGLERKLEKLTEKVKNEADDETKKQIEAELTQAESDFHSFSAPVDELLGRIATAPAALARASLGGFEVLMPVDASDADLLPHARRFSRREGALDRKQICYLSDSIERVGLYLTTPFDRKSVNSAMHPFVKLHLKHNDECWNGGYTTGGSLDRIYAGGEISGITITYNFYIGLGGNGREPFNVSRAETSMEVSFHGKHRGVTHTYRCSLTHQPGGQFPYQLSRALHIRNRVGGLFRDDRHHETEMKPVSNADEVKKYAAALPAIIASVPKKDELEEQIRRIAATYRDPFHTELQDFKQQGLNLGPEGYLTPKPGILRRLLGL